MDIEQKLELITRPPSEEIVSVEDLKQLLETNAHPIHYIGLEVSGLLHLGSLVITGYKLRDLLKAGVRCTVFLADWHSYINDKLGGNWQRIQQASKYYADAFSFFCPGVEIRLGSELYSNTNDYWRNVVRFCKQITLPRLRRCLTIMGRKDSESLDFAQYLYPPMQAVDIWALDLDIVHAGMDQRKVHMLVREQFPRLGWKKPVAIHHHLLPGLSEPTSENLDEDQKMDTIVSSKMSKSKPWTCIFIHDSQEQIKEKLMAAWCPPRITEGNPVIEITKHLVFHERDSWEVERAERYGGDIFFGSYNDLERAYADGEVHPADLKRQVAMEVNRIIEPLRDRFEGRKSLLGPLMEDLGKGERK